MKQNFDSKADVWSLGILLFELCELEPPFLDDPPMQVQTPFFGALSHLNL